MSEKEPHSGGCSCGAVRYETHGNPTRVQSVIADTVKPELALLSA